MAWLSWAIPAAVGLFGSINSANKQSAAQNQATTAATQDAAQQTALEQQMMSLYDTLANEYTTNYEPLVAPTAGAYSNLLSPAGADLGPAFQELQNYLLDPSGTLSGTGGVGRLSLPMLYNEAVNGLDPATWDAALGSVQTQGARTINSLENELGPALANPTGLAGDVAMQTLGATADTAAQLAGENQQFKNAALSSLQTDASGMDAQTLAMLNEAYNNPTGALTNIEQFINQGRSYLPNVASGIGGIAAQYAQAGTQAANNAAFSAQNAVNPFTSLGATLANSPSFQNMFSRPAAATPLPPAGSYQSVANGVIPGANGPIPSIFGYPVSGGGP